MQKNILLPIIGPVKAKQNLPTTVKIPYRKIFGYGTNEN
jgi:hypothetical protein